MDSQSLENAKLRQILKGQDMDIFEFAMEKEKYSENYYRELAGEEQKRFILLESICDSVAKPESYLEDAEFYHLDDYVEGVF